MAAAAALTGCGSQTDGGHSVSLRSLQWRANGAIHALAVAGGKIFVGGEFHQLGVHSGAVVALGPRGAPRAFPPVRGGSVNAIEADGDGGWFIGGEFTRAGSSACPHLARIRRDLTIDRRWCRPRARLGNVSALARVGSVLLVGSGIGVGGNGLAALDARSGRVRWRGRAEGVWDLAVAGSNLLVAGIGIKPGPAGNQYLVALDTATGEPQTWNPRVKELPGEDRFGPPPPIMGTTVVGGDVIVWGSFESIGGAHRAGLAALDARTGTATTWEPSPNGGIAQVVARGGRIYVLGEFTRIAGQARAGLAEFDARTGTLLPWRPQLSVAGAHTMAVAGHTVYVGGSSGDGVESPGFVASIDGESGRAGPLRARPDGDVDAIAVSRSGRTVLVGGQFSSFAGVRSPGLVTLDQQTWLPTAKQVSATDPATGGEVDGLAAADGRLFVAGVFERLGGVARDGIAVVDPAAGVVERWQTADGLDQVLSVAVSDRAVHAVAVGADPVAYSRSSGASLLWNPALDGRTIWVLLAGSADRVYLWDDFSQSIRAVDATSGKRLHWRPPPELARTQVITALAASARALFVVSASDEASDECESSGTWTLGAVDHDSSDYALLARGRGGVPSAIAPSARSIYLAGACGLRRMSLPLGYAP